MSPVDRSWMGKKNEALLIQSSGANGQKEIPDVHGKDRIQRDVVN